MRDDLSVVRGAENILAVRLRAASGTHRVYARCCGAALFAFHPMYAGRAVAVVRDQCVVEGFDDCAVSGAFFYDGVDGAIEAVEAAGCDPRMCVPSVKDEGVAEKVELFSAALGTPSRERVLGGPLDIVERAVSLIIE